MKRFWTKINKNGRVNRRISRCWQWVGAMAGNYGDFCLNGKRISAHRHSWELHYGSIPSSKFVCHRCDNPLCVNPDHLFLGTQKDNMRDRDAKMRQAMGVAHYKSILTESQVKEIRSKYQKHSREFGCGAFARKFNVNVITIYQVVKGWSWKHVK